MSHVKTDKLSARTASGTVELGVSGETISIPSGVTISNSGTATGFGVSNKFCQVVLGSDQTVTKNVITKMNFDTELQDPNGWFDAVTNYRFQPDEAGFYFCHAEIASSNLATSYDACDLYFYKNGSEVLSHENEARNSYITQITLTGVIEFNGSTDYVEIYSRWGANGTLTWKATAFNGATATNCKASFVRLT